MQLELELNWNENWNWDWNSLGGWSTVGWWWWWPLTQGSLSSGVWWIISGVLVDFPFRVGALGAYYSRGPAELILSFILQG